MNKGQIAFKRHDIQTVNRKNNMKIRKFSTLCRGFRRVINPIYLCNIT